MIKRGIEKDAIFNPNLYGHYMTLNRFLPLSFVSVPTTPAFMNKDFKQYRQPYRESHGLEVVKAITPSIICSAWIPAAITAEITFHPT